MKLTVSEQKTLRQTLATPIRWGDMDAMGHVNNTVYFRYMETARIEMLRGAGFPMARTGHGFVVANIFCNFLRQLEFPGDVLIRTYVGPIGRSSFDVYHELSRADDTATVYANGGETVVWIDIERQKSQSLPAALRAWLEQPPDGAPSN